MAFFAECSAALGDLEAGTLLTRLPALVVSSLVERQAHSAHGRRRTTDCPVVTFTTPRRAGGLHGSCSHGWKQSDRRVLLSLGFAASKQKRGRTKTISTAQPTNWHPSQLRGPQPPLVSENRPRGLGAPWKNREERRKLQVVHL
jgi:hypothetical protein